MNEEKVCDEVVRLLRIQRHDFINHLQVLHALLQMGKIDRAMNYMEDLAKDTNAVPELLLQHNFRSDCRQKSTT